ncbi:MAG: thiamine pyrophosphate-binding protein [Gaiella sp.]
MTRTGGRILVDQLALHGVKLAFGVPGESYLAVLDALIDSPVRFVSCRHEGGAANMAEAVGKLTGHPGVCLVTRGPGATHASSGLHTAFQDGTPLLLLIGQIARGDRERQAFQELDYRRTFGEMAKWVAEVDSAERIPELVQRAFVTATSGRPGPVVLALPEDVLAEESRVTDALPFVAAQADPSPAAVDEARTLLGGAERPLVVVGGKPWTNAAHGALGAWCSASGVPVAAGWRCQDYVDNRSEAYVGHLGLGPDPRLAARLQECDVLLAIGARLGDIETNGYTALSAPVTGKTLIHVQPAGEELGRVFQPALPVVSSGAAFAEALGATDPLPRSARDAWAQAARADYLDNLQGRAMPGAVDPAAIVGHLREALPEGAIVSNGAGNFTIWAHRFYEFRRYGTQLAPTSGSMGYGVPAAVGAKLLHRERTVVCLAGDGDFLMTGQELATAVQHDAPVIVVVLDNGMYGTIRMHQERHYPGRVSGTELRNPDFAALARAYGGHGETVDSTEAFPAALERSLAAGLPAVIHVKVDPEVLTPRQTLTEVREAAKAVRS